MNTNTNAYNNIYSLYIPRVLHNITEEYVKDIFDKQGVGMPYRVDFTPCGMTTGFKTPSPGTRPHFKSAFVHFKHYYNSVYSVFDFHDLENGVAQVIELEPHWRILKNRSPVQTTMMNIHQTVANCALLERRIDELESIVSSQNQIIQEHIVRAFRLKEQIKKTVSLICDITDSDEDLSTSTHSSMPELEPIEETLTLSRSNSRVDFSATFCNNN
jgi:uncharacterized coiled-coil protein SlyX